MLLWPPSNRLGALFPGCSTLRHRETYLHLLLHARTKAAFDLNLRLQPRHGNIPHSFADLSMRPPAGRFGVSSHEQEDLLPGVVGQRAHVCGVGKRGAGLAAVDVLGNARVAPGNGEKGSLQ